MNLRWDEDFVEAAVLAVAQSPSGNLPSLQVRRFHGERERCYRLTDADERNDAFFRCHLVWFRSWGLEGRLTGVVREFPLIEPGLQLLAFRTARGQRDEGAELYVSAENGRTAVVALRPALLESQARVQEILRHECGHLADMLDPAFGYSPELPSTGPGGAHSRILRERYRLLWDIAIDGRLERSGRGIEGRRRRHEVHFSQAFHFWPESRRAVEFESLWNEPRPNHAALMVLAADPRGLEHAAGPLPGAACPLCGFPTFEWAEVPVAEAATLDRVKEAFPEWVPAAGACRRCFEIYECAGQFELPSTVVL